MTRKHFKTSLIFCVLFSFLMTFLLPADCKTTKKRKLREIQEKQENLQKKIKETKEKEKVAINRLTQIQRRLQNTQDELRKSKFKLESTQTNLQEIEEELANVKHNFLLLQVNSKDRIRQIYQGQRLKMLEILLQSPSVTDFLDNLYYQKLLVANDRRLLEEMEQKSKEIEAYKDKLAEQKEEIAIIINRIDDQKKLIANEHSIQSNLVDKLRTERESYERAERELEKNSNSLIAEINRLVGTFASTGGGRGTGQFSYPVHARISSPFGPRRHPIHKVISFHSGIDLAAPNGTPIMASDSGVVIFNGWYGGYGKVVIVDHGKDYTTLYAHLSKAIANKGKSIGKGEVVGYEGQTGYSTGPHLHFEVRKYGKPQNPLNFLQ